MQTAHVLYEKIPRLSQITQNDHAYLRRQIFDFWVFAQVAIRKDFEEFKEQFWYHPFVGCSFGLFQKSILVNNSTVNTANSKIIGGQHDIVGCSPIVLDVLPTDLDVAFPPGSKRSDHATWGNDVLLHCCFQWVKVNSLVWINDVQELVVLVQLHRLVHQVNQVVVDVVGVRCSCSLFGFLSFVFVHLDQIGKLDQFEVRFALVDVIDPFVELICRCSLQEWVRLHR